MNLWLTLWLTLCVRDARPDFSMDLHQIWWVYSGGPGTQTDAHFTTVNPLTLSGRGPEVLHFVSVRGFAIAQGYRTGGSRERIWKRGLYSLPWSVQGFAMAHTYRSLGCKECIYLKKVGSAWGMEIFNPFCLYPAKLGIQLVFQYLWCNV